MANAVDLTSAFQSFKGSYHTGSMYPCGDTFGAGFLDLGSDTLTTASWFGNNNMWFSSDVINDSTFIGGFTGSLVGGTWWGIENSCANFLLPYENTDRFTLTSDKNPSVNQGNAMVDWDPFPVPPRIYPRFHVRDATRFRKSYSFGRNLPVRYRLILNPNPK